MLFRGRQRVERSDARGFLAFLDRKVLTQASEMERFRFTTGSMPLRKSKSPVSEDST
jgi:hypothetical protein